MVEDRNAINHLTEIVPLSNKVRVGVIPELTHPELFQLPIKGWPNKADYLVDALALVISRQAQSTRKLYLPGASGRAGFLQPFVFETNENHPTIFTNLYLKGIGIANVEDAILAVSSSADPHLGDKLGMKWTENTPTFDWVPGATEVPGMMTVNDARLDGQNSLKMHQLGARARLPIVSFKIQEIQVDDRLIKVEDLVKMGWPIKLDTDGWPVISCWARRNIFTFRDASRILSSGSSRQEKKNLADELTATTFGYLQFETDKEGCKLAKAYLQLNKLGGQTREKKAMFLEKELVLWMADMYGRQMAIFKRKGIYHGMPTNQNTSIGVEFSDNSENRFCQGFKEFKDFKERHESNLRSFLWYLQEFQTNLDEARGQKSEDAFLKKIETVYYRSYKTYPLRTFAVRA